MTTELTETAVQVALTTTWVGQSYYYLPTTLSTNDWLKQEAPLRQLPTGAVCLTDYQSGGRGRFNRRWETLAGTSLLFSVFLRPDWPARQSNWLTMMAGLAVAEGITQVTGLTAALKWPNDIMLLSEGVWRKVGGLLLEGEIDARGRLAVAILGIGINVNIPALELPTDVLTPATSLLVVGGRHVSRLALLVAVLQRLEGWYETAVAGQSPQPAWNQRLMTLGQHLQVTRTGQPPLFGLAEGTDEWGQLLLRDTAGVRHTIAAGDVTLRV